MSTPPTIPMRGWFRNAVSVPVGGRPPGAVFRLEVAEPGLPADVYWRRRLTDGDIEVASDPITSPDPGAAPPAASEASPSGPASSEAPRRKKGA